MCDRECIRCGEVKPLTSRYFVPIPKGNSFRRVCRDCIYAEARANYHKRQQPLAELKQAYLTKREALKNGSN